MKLATIENGTRDGLLAVVSQDGERFARAGGTLQGALDDWDSAELRLRALAADLDAGRVPSEALDPRRLLAPLPRAYEWVDGSAFLSHVVLVRKARGASPPDTLATDPLVYQGGSGVLLSSREPLVLPDEAWGMDFEGEVCAVLGDTPQGVSPERSASCIRLFLLANDVTYRNLVPAELTKGFGFFQSKPATAFSAFAVTPDELAPALRDGRVHLPLRVSLNGAVVGDPDASAMHFSFHDLIAHIAKTRAFTAGTILGSGTVSNDDPARGVSCLAERRARETLEYGAPRTPFLRAGDRVHIDMTDARGRSLFGGIEQEVVAP